MLMVLSVGNFTRSGLSYVPVGRPCIDQGGGGGLWSGVSALGHLVERTFLGADFVGPVRKVGV